MYRIVSINSTAWTIVDNQQRIAFQGSSRECEDWLDLRENAQNRCSKRVRWFERLESNVHRIMNAAAAAGRASLPSCSFKKSTGLQ